MKNFRRILSLATTLVMLISMVAVPQVSAAETADEVLVFADFEETKGGFQGQFQSGNGTLTGGIDRVYADDTNGKSLRIYCLAQAATTTFNEEIAFVNLDSKVATGKLHISYQTKISNVTPETRLQTHSAAIADFAGATNPINRDTNLLFMSGKGTIGYVEKGATTKSGDVTITADEWCQVDAILDFDADKADYFVNGENIGSTALHDGVKAGINALVFRVKSRAGSGIGTGNNGDSVPISQYIDNLKVAKLVTTGGKIEVDSTSINKDKNTITLNLSETVATMPNIATTDVKVVKRGEDDPVQIDDVDTENKKVIVKFSTALTSGTEYEVSVNNKEFTGINGSTATGLKGYLYVNPETAVVYEENFDDVTSTPFLLGSNKAGSTSNFTSVDVSIKTDYEGRGNVHSAKNNSVANSNTSDFSAYKVLDKPLDVNKKYVISYSNMFRTYYTGNAGNPRNGHGLAVSSATELASSPLNWFSAYDYKQGATNGYMMLLAASGGGTAGTYNARYASYMSPKTVGAEKRRYLIHGDVIEETNAGVNNGEWYDVAIVVDMENDTADYYYDGRYVGTQTSDDALDFNEYTVTGDEETGYQLTNPVKKGIQTLVFSALIGNKVSNGALAENSRGEYMLDDIKIEEFDGGKFDKQLESIRFVDKAGKKAFSTATVSTLYNKIELTGKNVANVSDFGAVTLTATPDGGSANTVDFTASYENGIYTIDLGKYLTGNTTYTLSALGEEYTFKTEAGSFEVESIELYKVTGSGDDEVETLLTNIADVAAGDKVRSTVKFINTTGKPQNAWLPIAYYNGKRLSGVMYDELSTDGTETEITKSVDITVSSITDLSISGFVWESKDVIRPLIKNTTLD